MQCRDSHVPCRPDVRHLVEEAEYVIWVRAYSNLNINPIGTPGLRHDRDLPVFGNAHDAMAGKLRVRLLHTIEACWGRGMGPRPQDVHVGGC